MALISELNTYASNPPTSAWIELEVSGAAAKISPTAFFSGIANLSSLSGSQLATGDRLLVADVSAASGAQAKYIGPTDIFHTIPLLSYMTVPDAPAQIAFYGDGGSPRRTLLTDLFYAGTNLSTFSDPATSDHLWAMDGGVPKLLTMGNFLNIITALTTFSTLVDNASGSMFYRHGDGFMYAISPNRLFGGTHTMNIPAASLRSRSANGCAALATTSGAANQPDIPYLAFDGAAAEYATFGPFAFPKGWNGGTIMARFAWRRASGTGAANVVWGIRALSIGSNESPAQNFGTGATVTAAASTTTANFMWSSFTSACTIAGSPAKGDMIFLEVYRDGASGSDTLNSVDAWLSDVELVFTTDARDDS